MTKTLILTLAIVALSSANVLEQYESKSLLSKSKGLNPHYAGPLCITGGALADMNKYIEKMEPTKVGTVTANSISILDSVPLTYTFKRVKTYTVTQDNAKYNVYYMKAKMDGERYDIIIELRGTHYYDRILRIYKNDEPHSLMLWIDTLRVIQKKEERI